MNVTLEHHINKLQIMPSMEPPRGHHPNVFPRPSFMPCRTRVVALIISMPSVWSRAVGIARTSDPSKLSSSPFVVPPRWHCTLARESTHSSASLDHKWTTLIRAYPFGVMTGPPWTIDAVLSTHVSVPMCIWCTKLIHTRRMAPS